MNAEMVNLATDQDWAAPVGAFGIFAVIAVIVWQVGATFRARAAAARDRKMEALAESFAELSAQQARTQLQTSADLAEMKASVAAMEKLMREVE